MKNFIMFFYNMSINNIKKRLNGDYQFEYNKEQFILKDITNNDYDISAIYDQYLFLKNNNIICNGIILNKDKNVASFYKNNIYVLTKPTYNYKNKITIKDIINYDININNIGIPNWRNLWINKIDYYEYNISQTSKKIPLISESFHYFEGLTENAIQLLSSIKEVQLYVSHRRINYGSTLYDLYDPFNIIIDTRVRDVADYFKDKFINNQNLNIIEYLKIANLNTEELKLFFVRIIYPSYYFDLCDQIFLTGNATKIKRIIDMIPKYELLISELANYINKYNYIIDIPEWLNQH